MSEFHGFADKGFAAAPRRCMSRGDEVIYRYFGGRSPCMGPFFSPLKFTHVSQAEYQCNIVKWGNMCRFCATYRVKPGVAMWIGRVEQEEGSGGFAGPLYERSALQIYIDRPEFKVILIEDIEPLRQDLFVSPRAGNA